MPHSDRISDETTKPQLEIIAIAALRGSPLGGRVSFGVYHRHPYGGKSLHEPRLQRVQPIRTSRGIRPGFPGGESLEIIHLASAQMDWIYT